MYTVKQVSTLAGVTPRTLHHYDAIGLLKPSRISDNGYRHYGEEALLRLQQILFYRELGLDLASISKLMDARDFSVVRALETHRKALLNRIARLQTLVSTVDRTLSQQKGEKTMKNEEWFDGLSDQEKAYAEEASQKWDPAVVKESNRRYAQLTPAEKAKMKADGEQFNKDWARLIGTDPAGPRAQAMVAEWRKGIEFFWTPTIDMLVPLAQMYNEDERFKANYDKVDSRLAAFVLDCVLAYVKS